MCFLAFWRCFFVALINISPLNLVVRGVYYRKYGRSHPMQLTHQSSLVTPQGQWNMSYTFLEIFVFFLSLTCSQFFSAGIPLCSNLITRRCSFLWWWLHMSILLTRVWWWRWLLLRGWDSLYWLLNGWHYTVWIFGRLWTINKTRKDAIKISNLS